MGNSVRVQIPAHSTDTHDERQGEFVQMSPAASVILVKLDRASALSWSQNLSLHLKGFIHYLRISVSVFSLQVQPALSLFSTGSVSIFMSH